MTEIEVEFTTKHKISYERLASVLVGFLEGNSTTRELFENYDMVEPKNWDTYKEVYRHVDDIGTRESIWYYCYPFNEGGALIFNEYEGVETDEPQKRRLDLNAIKRGIKILAEKYPYHLQNIIEENEDAYTSNALYQCALYGDIIAG